MRDGATSHLEGVEAPGSRGVAGAALGHFGRLAALLAAAALAGGCAALPLPGTERGEGPVTALVSVEEVPGEDAWRVGYSLSSAVAGVEFLRDRTPFRHERWAVAARGAEAAWRVDGSTERLCFSRRTRSFALSFRTWAQPLPKDHELNVVFSEGSRLLDTGHLLVRPLASCGEGLSAPPAAQPELHFTFRTAPERTVRVLDRASTGELRWEPPPGDEEAADTYVYFGGLEPVEGEAATVLLDPGLPGWMKTEMARVVPGLVERFTAATATPLPFRPLLFVAWGGDHGSGRTFSGGTLPGLLLASAQGPGWLEETPEARREWFHRVAHEAFHLWDGEVYRPDEDAGWLSEAAAEHFALEAAVAFGVRDEEEARRRRVEQANDCLVRLEGRSLAAAVGGGDDDAWSSCGTVAMAAAEGALRRAQPASGLDDLFRRLFEHAGATGGYGAGAFLGGLKELHAEPRALADLRWLIRGSGEVAGDRFLEKLLGHAGIAVELVPPAEATAEPATLREMVQRAFGRCYCGTGEAASCDPVATGRELAAVAGEPVAGDLLAAWRRLRSAVARGAALPVVLGDEEVTLFCAEDAFDPSWRSLLGLPAAAAR